MSDDLVDRLRAWATGSYGVEAGTELLLRYRGGRFARPGWPWIHDVAPRPWIDFAALAEGVAALSGAERSVLLLAAALADGRPFDLADAVCGLDRRSLALVLAAIAHAAGSHEHTEVLAERSATGEEIVSSWGPRIQPGRWIPGPTTARTSPERAGGGGEAGRCRGRLRELVDDEAPAIRPEGPRGPAATGR